MLGKSAGAVLALLALQRGVICPDRLVLIGLPLGFARAVDVDVRELLAELTVPTLLIQ